MPYWRLYYHLVWATRGREPILVDDAEETVRRVVGLVADEMRAHAIAVGTVLDHIHVVASIPPSVAVSDVVKAMKGRSTRLINRDRGDDATNVFGWQTEYGVLSFGEQALPRVVAYVEHQCEHHARDNLWPKLEIISGEPTNTHQQSPERTSIG